MDQLARLEALEAENLRLLDRIAALEALTGVDRDLPSFLGMTAQQGRIIALLLKRETATKEQLMHALYGHLPDTDAAEPKIVEVFIHHIRRKLRPFGIEIETLWGRGYCLTSPMRAKLTALVEQRRVA